MPERFKNFDPSLVHFLSELVENNNRDWFHANKKRYDVEVVDQVMDFIREMAPRIASISPHFKAEAKKVGGSMFRIYRDTRFSKDKTPYKTHIGIRFPHRESTNIGGAGFYVGISPKDVTIGCGSWHPESSQLTQIRSRVDGDPDAWVKIRDARKLKSRFEFGGESLKSAPRGFAKDHLLIEDLKRKDWVVFRTLDIKTLHGPDFVKETHNSFKAAGDFVRFLTETVGQPF